MYETFYHLSATPFRLTPDPEFCFPHSGYARARAYLQYAFELGEGFIVLTGRVGAGKTTLVKAFLKDLETRNVATATIAAANIEATDLLRCVAYVYDIKAENLDKATLLRRISQHLGTLAHRRRRALLVVDEAQGLSSGALEELRLLADLTEGARPLLQIFLVGQEALRGLLRDPGAEQLRQRVIGTCRLEPMGLAETRDYIQHRLRCAGWSGDPQLTGDAVFAIFQYSGGTPRHVNKLCTRLMLQGFMGRKHTLDKADVSGIADELDEEQLAPAPVPETELDEGSAEAARAAALRNDATALSALAIRAPGPVRDAGGRSGAPQRARRQVVPAVREPSFADTTTRDSGVRNATVSHLPGWRRSGVGSGVQGTNTLWAGARHRVGVFAQRMVHEVFRLEETPALLFSVVAVVTVSAASFTSYLQHRALQRQNLFVLGSPPLHVAQDSLGSGASGVLAMPSVVQPVLPGRGKVVSAPVQATGQQEPGSTPVGEKSGVDADDSRHRASAPGKAVTSAAAVETPPVSPLAAVPVHTVPDTGTQPPVDSTSGSDAASDAESARSRAKNASAMPPDRPHAAPDKPATGAAAVPAAGVRAKVVRDAVAHSPVGKTGGDPASDAGTAPSGVKSTSATPTNRSHTAPAEPAKSAVAMPVPPAAGVKAKVVRDAVASSGPGAAGGSGKPPSTGRKHGRAASPPAKEIGNLVALAGQAMDEDRLLIPPGNSAYSYYGRVLLLDPGNEEALAGLKRIVARYIEMASDAIAHRDNAGAMLYVDRGLRVQPDNDRLLVLKDMISRLSIAGQSGQPPPAPLSGGYRQPAAALEYPPGETPQPDGMLDRIKGFFSKKTLESTK